MQKLVMRHVELVASTTTIITTLILPKLLHQFGLDWAIIWFIALVITVLILGGMLYVVYRRRRVVRRKTINEVRQMLHDRVRNHLATVWLNVQMTPADQKRRDHIREAIEAIDQELNTLSEDTLMRWQGKYETFYDEFIATRPPDNTAA